MVNSIINPGINFNSARKNVFKKLYYGEWIKGATERFTEKMGRILYYHKKHGNEQHTALQIMPKVKTEYFRNRMKDEEEQG